MTTTSCFDFASEEELSKLADLVDERFTPANTARQNPHSRCALNDFQQWMAIIIVTLLHAVHVYRYYVAIIIQDYQLCYIYYYTIYINYSIILRLLYSI